MRGRREGDDPIHEFAAPMPQLSQAAHGFHPAEDLLDQFAFLLADGIARVTRRAAVDLTAFDLLRDVRRERQGAHPRDKARHVEALIPTDGAAMRQSAEQQQRRLAFGGARRRGGTDGGHQPMPIVEQHMTRVGELGFSALALTRKLGVRIRRRLMGVVAPRGTGNRRNTCTVPS